MRCNICGAMCRNVLRTTDGRQIYQCTTNFTHLSADLQSTQGFVACHGVYDNTGKQIDVNEYLAYESEGHTHTIRVYDLVGK
jgi:hypothetical protein